MRRSFALALAVPFFGSLFACTAILGNYSVGTVATDAGTDVGGDVTQPDGGPDADAGPDAAPPAPMLCDVNGQPSLLSNLGMTAQRLSVHPLPGSSKSFRVVAQGSQQALNTYTFDDGNQTTTPLLVTAPGGANLIGYTSYDGGFILILLSKPGASWQINAIRLDDTGSAPTQMFTVVSAVSDEIQQDFQFTLAPINAGQHSFFFAYSNKNLAGKWDIHAHSVNLDPTASPLPTEPQTFTMATRANLYGAHVVLDKTGNKAVLLMGADQGSNDLQILQTDLAGQLLKAPTAVAAPGGAFFIPLLGTSAPGNQNLNGVATIQGDLGNTSIPFGIRVGSFDGAKLSSGWDPTQLPPFYALPPSQVAVDKGNAIWQFFANQPPQYVAAARATQTGNGVNLNWFDGLGQARALRGGNKALFALESVQTAAAALVDAPNAVAANLVVTWQTANNDVKLAKIGCVSN